MEKLTGGPGWSIQRDDDPAPAKKPNPNGPSAKIRMEKRFGKAVTVISGLHTYGLTRLEAIAKVLKTKFASGGTVKDGCIEIQGDRADEIRAWFKDGRHREIR